MGKGPDKYRLLIKNEDGKTREILGSRNQHGQWVDDEGTTYYGDTGSHACGWKQPDPKKVIPATKWYLLDAVPQVLKGGSTCKK